MVDPSHPPSGLDRTDGAHRGDVELLLAQTTLELARFVKVLVPSQIIRQVFGGNAPESPNPAV
jgi:hypothetical protein